MGFVSKAIGTVMKPIGGILGSTLDPLTGAMTTENKFQAQLPSDVVQQQKDLAAALLAQSQGQGPNPAQAQFQDNLSQVGAQQAGAIASQKGISPALQARMIANQGQQAQMQGAGAAAALQAQQQIEAQRQLANQQSQLVGQDLQAQGINASISKDNAAAQNQVMQGILGGASAAMMPKKAYGGPITIADALMQRGGKVPGKAQMAGDHPKNDTVHAMLSPGEIVIPRSLAEDPERAKRFIEELKGKKKPGYGKVLEAKRKK